MVDTSTVASNRLRIGNNPQLHGEAILIAFPLFSDGYTVICGCTSCRIARAFSPLSGCLVASPESTMIKESADGCPFCPKVLLFIYWASIGPGGDNYVQLGNVRKTC